MKTPSPAFSRAPSPTPDDPAGQGRPVVRSPKRIALLGFHLESNAFAPVSDAAAFHSLCYMSGDEILADVGRANPSLPAEIPAFCAAMDRSGVDWRPVPIVVTAAEPGGPCDHAFFGETLHDMRVRLTDALPVDGVYISNHGAMISTMSHDPDGLLYRMVRDVVGPGVPVIATIDLHANISQLMVVSVDVLISYRTNPHVDQEQRATEAADLMVEMFRGLRPESAFLRLPLTPATVTLLTAEGPYADLVAYGQRAKTPDIVNVSVVGGFVFGDSPKNGLAVIVTARQDLEAARRLAADIATKAWDMRHRFTRTLTSIDEAVAIAVANGKDESRPAVILGDVADNPGGGGGGNTTWLLSALYEAGAAGVFMGNLVDPAVAEAAHSHGEGATFEAVFNSIGETEFARRFAAPAAVEKLSAGACVGRRGIWAGRSISLGPSALLDIGGIKVVVASLRKQCADPVFFEMVGLDIAAARTVVVKSRGHFRAGFDEYFAPEQVYEVDAPGLTSPVLSRFAFKDLPRPVFPLDEDATWAGPPW